MDTASIISFFCPEKDKEGNKIKKGDLLHNIKNNQFDIEFIELARSVYKNNDARFKIKSEINFIL